MRLLMILSQSVEPVRYRRGDGQLPHLPGIDADMGHHKHIRQLPPCQATRQTIRAELLGLHVQVSLVIPGRQHSPGQLFESDGAAHDVNVFRRHPPGHLLDLMQRGVSRDNHNHPLRATKPGHHATRLAQRVRDISHGSPPWRHSHRQWPAARRSVVPRPVASAYRRAPSSRAVRP